LYSLGSGVERLGMPCADLLARGGDWFLEASTNRLRRIFRMRRLLGFLVFLAIVLVAVCLWQGWITIFVDKQKFKQDTKELRHEAKQEAEKIKEEVHTGAQKLEQKTDN
jgi:type VI protein secretion system component VasK